MEGLVSLYKISPRYAHEGDVSITPQWDLVTNYWQRIRKIYWPHGVHDYI